MLERVFVYQREYVRTERQRHPSVKLIGVSLWPTCSGPFTASSHIDSDTTGFRQRTDQPTRPSNTQIVETCQKKTESDPDQRQTCLKPAQTVPVRGLLAITRGRNAVQDSKKPLDRRTVTGYSHPRADQLSDPTGSETVGCVLV